MNRSSEERLREEYDRFIEFGQLLDRRMRKYLVRYLSEQLGGSAVVDLPELNDQYFIYFKKALQAIFELEALGQVVRANTRIGEQVARDTIRWLRKAHARLEQANPYQEELDYLAGWAVTPVHVFLKRWPFLIQYLQGRYGREDLDTAYYRDRLGALIPASGESPDTESQGEIDLLLSDLLAQWDARLHARILEHQLQQLEKEKEAFLDLLESKATEYRQLQELIEPFTDYLGWDLSRNLWQDTSFDILKHYHQLLEDEDSLRELADLLGRMREAEIEIEEETLERTIVRKEWVSDPRLRAEIDGVHTSDDLSSMLSSEAGLLGDPHTEDLFLKRLVDKQLMTFRYADQQLKNNPQKQMEVRQRVKKRERGPFIVCIDTSESMSGRPEQIAKVLCLGILRMAMREQRRAYLINFSVGIQTLDLFDIANSIDELAAFLRKSFYGGTDVTPALHEALRMLRGQDYADADVLLISDFIMPKINQTVLRELGHFQQNKQTQFHSLTLSADPNAEVLEAFDTNWIYDPERKGIIRELTAGLQAIGQTP